MRERGHIDEKESKTTRYRNLQLTKAERGSSYSFQTGQMIRFQQNAKGNIKRGTQFEVSKVDKHNVWIKDHQGTEKKLDLTQSKHFNVYEKQSIALSSGDAIRITEGGKSKDGKRLDNGAIYEIDKVMGNGDVKLTNGRILDADQGNINYGYVTTSHASQGKTVRHVLIAQSTENGGASSAEQFYVSVSRGKKSVEIFTDNKKELREQIKSSHQRLSATELTKNQSSVNRDRQREIERMIVIQQQAQKRRHAKAQTVKNPSNDTWRDRVRPNQNREMSRE